MKYETNQAEICRHANIWRELLVHPIMANVDAVYAFLDKDTRAYIYDLCVKTSQIYEITEYNNTTHSLLLPNQAQYNNLEIVRVVVENSFNIYNLIQQKCFPVLRVLEIMTVKLENIESLKLPTLEELAIIVGGKLNTENKLKYSVLAANYKKLKKLSLKNGTIYLDRNNPETLVLIECALIVTGGIGWPKHLTLMKCKTIRLFSGTISTEIDSFSLQGNEIEFENTIKSLKLLDIDDGIDLSNTPELKELHLDNSECKIPSSVETLTLVKLAPGKLSKNVTHLTLKHVSPFKASMMVNLVFLSLSFIGSLINDVQILETCTQLRELTLTSCATVKDDLVVENENLVLRYYNCTMSNRAVIDGNVREIHITGYAPADIKMKATIRRLSYYGFTLLNPTEFIQYCLNNYRDKVIEDYDEIFSDLFFMKLGDPEAYTNYYAYFMSLKFICSAPTDDPTYYRLIKEGNQNTRLIFENGSQYSIQAIRENELDSDIINDAHARYKNLESTLSVECQPKNTRTYKYIAATNDEEEFFYIQPDDDDFFAPVDVHLNDDVGPTDVEPTDEDLFAPDDDVGPNDIDEVEPTDDDLFAPEDEYPDDDYLFAPEDDDVEINDDEE